MQDTNISIKIRPAEKSQLDFLQSEFSPHTLSRYHHERHAVQEKGEGIYLIAWHNDVPVGHFLLRWNGPEKDTSGKYPYPTPYLEVGLTKEAYRRKGVATQLIKEAERLAKEKGFKKIGMAVGSTDNPDARRLYEKLGYEDWGKGEFTASWEYIDKKGNKGTESEVCIYLFKNL